MSNLVVKGVGEEALLIVLYEVPDKPSKVKVGIWRKLRSLGGLYPRLSLCVLPDRKEIREALKIVLRDVRESGIAVALEAKTLSETDASQLHSALVSVKEKEYSEILEECNEFLDEIRENIEKGNVTQEEAEELEEMLDALKRWYERVRSSDWLESPSSRDVEEKLKECEKALEDFVSLCLRNLGKYA